MKGSAMRGNTVKRILCAGMMLVMVLAIAACGGGGKGASNSASNTGVGSSKPYHELRWGLLSFSGVLDWTRNPNGYMASVESLAVDNLMEYEPDGKVKPGLASSVEQPNSTTYIYHLKSVKFSDGKPMTAADVVFSLDRNITAKESWTKPYWEDVASISAPNSSTVLIKLKRPSAIFQDVVAFSGEVVEKAAAEKVSEKELGTPGHMLIGTGPWKLDSYQPEASVQLSANPYWKGPRTAENITVNLFKSEATMALAVRSGAIDGVFYYISSKTFANIPGVHQILEPSTTWALMSVNTAMRPFNDVHVRRALAYATDSQGLIDALYPAGTAQEDVAFGPSSLLTDLASQGEINKLEASLPTYKFNLAAAKQELAKSAYPHGFTTTLEVPDSTPALVSAAQILSADFKKIGITVKIDEYPPSAEASTNDGKTKLLLTEDGAIYPDIEGLMWMLAASQIHPPGSGLNTANFRNAEFDKLQPEAVETLSKSKRFQMVSKMLNVVGKEMPYIPLYSHKTFSAISEKYVLPGPSFWTMIWTPWGLRVKLAS